MRIAYSWLTEILGQLPPVQEIAEMLTAQGIEVEEILWLGEGLRGAEVARAARMEALTPRLWQVDLERGAGTARVVTGAQNVAVGECVPYAPPGCLLPDGRTLGVAQFHGVESHGMLLSADELGLGTDRDGIMILAPDAPVGQALDRYLGLPEAVLQLALTPNIATYCQSAIGIAREVGARLGRRVTLPPPAEIGEQADLDVRIADGAPCPQYLGAGFERARDGQTPLWMRRRLWSSGMRCVHPFVDLTNYVMLELGQPMHPFDRHKLHGSITVRTARAGEQLELLDGSSLTLAEGDLLICDAHGAVGLAGVMGGASSDIEGSTDAIFLESAEFSARSIATTSRRHGLPTEAAQRYARGIDPQLTARAVARAAELAPQVGWRATGRLSSAGLVGGRPRAPIALRPAYVRKLLGLDLSAAEQAAALRRFDFAVSEGVQELQVQPPSYRLDVSIAADLVEEVLRAVGVDAVQEELPPLVAHDGDDQTYTRRQEAVDTFVRLGYREAVHTSLSDPAWLDEIGHPAQVRVANPLTVEASVMRSTLMAGLLLAVQRNASHDVEDVRLVEAGRVFDADGERDMVAGVLAGRNLPLGRFAQRDVDFYDVKGHLQAAFQTWGMPDPAWLPGDDPLLHPSRQARLVLNDATIGHAGSLHPKIAARLKLAQPVQIFELDFAQIEQIRQGRAIAPIARHPSLVRDLAIVVRRTVSYADVAQEIREGAGELVSEWTLFDVFDDPQGGVLAQDEISYAFRLLLQSRSRTLTEAEADEAIEHVLERLVARLGARRR